MKIENQSLYFSEAISKTKPLKTTSSTMGVSIEIYNKKVKIVKKSKLTSFKLFIIYGLHTIPSNVSTPNIPIIINQPIMNCRNKLLIVRLKLPLRGIWKRCLRV